MKTLLLDTNTDKYFYGFCSNGSIRIGDDIDKALDIGKFETTTSRHHIKRMLAAWYGKPFSKLGFEEKTYNYKNIEVTQ